jgi:hypothetical protein
MMAWFSPVEVDRSNAKAGACPEVPDGRPSLSRFAGCAAKNILAVTAVLLVACGAESRAQTTAAPQDQPAPAVGAAVAGDGLNDLDAMIFACARAALNAAAREAAKAPTQGSYQFAYFQIIGDSHHSSYEIHFKSNYQGEPDLKYCVAIYCQQGWDPKTTKASVQLMGAGRQPARTAAHSAGCANIEAPAKH